MSRNIIQLKQRLITWGAAVVVLLILIPLLGLTLAIVSSSNTQIEYRFSTLHEIWQYSDVAQLAFNTMALAITVSVLASLAGAWLAWIDQRSIYSGGKLLGIVGLLPLAMPSFLLAVVIREAFAPNAFLGSLLSGQLFKGFIPSVIVLTIITTPYVQLLVSAALARHSVAEEEAAKSLGASTRQIFNRVILPHLRPAFAFAWLLTCLYTISDFGAVAILDMPVLTWRLYQAVQLQSLAQASLYGIVILALTLPLLIIARCIHGLAVHRQKVSNPRPIARQPLGFTAKMLSYLLHGFIIGLGVVLPIYSLSEWVYLGWLYNNEFASLLKPISDTFRVAAWSSMGILLLALLPAYVVARQHKRYSWLFEQGVYLTNSLPGILLAFGLLLAALYLSRTVSSSVSLYHSLLTSGVLLFLGYAMRFMAQAYSGIKSALLSYDVRLHESARVLNASRWQYFSRVWLPGIGPGLTASFLLVFLAIIKELPVTLLLGNAMGIRTLSFRIFDRYQEAYLHDVGSSGLCLLVMTFLLVIMSLKWRRHV